MWKLPKPSEALIAWYVKEMCTSLYNRIKTKKDKQGNLLLNERIQNILVPNFPDGEPNLSILRKLLTNEPKNLHCLCDKLMKEIIDDYDENEFKNYIKAKAKKAINREANEEALINKYSDVLSSLLKVFDYGRQMSRKESMVAYNLTLEQGKNTCTYCNRQYVFTAVINNKENKLEKIARPELDHWFSKELYPLMSLSIYNLIPCCSICNRAKGNEIFSFKTHIHPYLYEPNEPEFEFRYRLNDTLHYEVVIDKTDKVKVENMLSAFKLRGIYRNHGELEVKDILQYGYQNSDAYLDYLLRNLLEHYRISKEEVYRMFFGTELEAKKDLNRPLSKLKRDILKQIGLFKEGEFFG